MLLTTSGREDLVGWQSPGVCLVVEASCDDLDRGGLSCDFLDRGFGGEAKSRGIVCGLRVVLTTSDEDLVAWQSPEASP